MAPSKTDRARVAALLEQAGQTYAEEAGIRLADRPSPLYQLLVLATLLSARITASVAVAAAGELFKAGYTTPQKMRDATWQQRVDALGRGHYRRYDERTATMLGDGADLVLERWHGDLRRLATEADHDPERIRTLLKEVPGIGDVGADIFLREAQAVWPWLRPFIDRRVSAGADLAHLPTSPNDLIKLVGDDEFPRLVAALVRVSVDRKLAASLSAAGEKSGS